MELAKAEKVNENLDMDDTADKPESCEAKRDIFLKFGVDLACLINKHSLENVLEMPDFMIAKLLVNILRAMSLAHGENNSWHGMQAYPDDYHDLQDLTK